MVKVFRFRIILPLALILSLLILLRGKRGKEVGEISEIKVDSLKKEIIFSGFIQKDSGWVQHLIYLRGYKWLKDNSAIVCSARLKDFQIAFASLDFYLWDSLWQRIGSQGERVELFIDDSPAESLVETKEKLSLWDIVFLGSPNFDYFALEGVYSVCQECPVFEIEKKVFEKLFIRKSGESGYYLNKRNFSKKGRVEIKVKIK